MNMLQQHINGLKVARKKKLERAVNRTKQIAQEIENAGKNTQAILYKTLASAYAKKEPWLTETLKSMNAPLNDKSLHQLAVYLHSRLFEMEKAHPGAVKKLVKSL